MMSPMTTVSDQGRRFSRLDPLAFLASAVALAVYLPHGFEGGLSRDLGVYSYAGQQFAEGVPPYVGILNRAGPLAHAIPGLGAWVARQVGADDILGMRVIMMLISAACIGLIYLLGRDVFRSRSAGLATAAAMLCSQGFIHYATYGPREKTAMVLFTICALLAMLHRRWGWTGFFIALATLTWQPVFPAAIVGAAVALLLATPSGKIRALARLAVGGLVPTVLVVAAYAAIGELQVFLDDFLLINARYTQQVSLLFQPDRLWPLLWTAYGWSLVVFLVGSVALVVLTVRAALTPATSRESSASAALSSGRFTPRAMIPSRSASGDAGSSPVS